MKFRNVVTRVLNPVVKEVRDVLQNVCEIDKYELKDSADIVIGWNIPRKDIELQEFLQKVKTVNLRKVAWSTSKDSESQVISEQFTFQWGDILIGVTAFESSYSIEVK